MAVGNTVGSLVGVSVGEVVPTQWVALSATKPSRHWHVQCKSPMNFTGSELLGSQSGESTWSVHNVAVGM
jgi:hypothetical protein